MIFAGIEAVFADELAAQGFTSDVAKLSCCAARPNHDTNPPATP